MHIDQLVFDFRKAIEAVRDNGGFDNNFFKDFPYYCCGTASELLAVYLANNGIKTLYISAVLGEDSHAWLVVADDELYKKYAVSRNFDDVGYDMLEELRGRVIIDITADQYKDRVDMGCYNVPVFIGEPDDFHKKFTVDCIGDYVGIANLYGLGFDASYILNKILIYMGKV